MANAIKLTICASYAIAGAFSCKNSDRVKRIALAAIVGIAASFALSSVPAILFNAVIFALAWRGFPPGGPAGPEEPIPMAGAAPPHERIHHAGGPRFPPPPAWGAFGGAPFAPPIPPAWVPPPPPRFAVPPPPRGAGVDIRRAVPADDHAVPGLGAFHPLAGDAGRPPSPPPAAPRAVIVPPLDFAAAARAGAGRDPVLARDAAAPGSARAVPGRRRHARSAHVRSPSPPDGLAGAGRGAPPARGAGRRRHPSPGGHQRDHSLG